MTKKPKLVSQRVYEGIVLTIEYALQTMKTNARSVHFAGYRQFRLKSLYHLWPGVKHLNTDL